jgi:hypothetical protein
MLLSAHQQILPIQIAIYINQIEVFMQHLIQHQQERQQDWLREQRQAQQAKLTIKRNSNLTKFFGKPFFTFFTRTSQLVVSSK